MAIVGVRQLKSQLSAYLRRAGSGARFTVTDRGRPIATIGPVDTTEDPAWARRMVKDGGARWAGGKPAGLRRRISQKGALASRMVIEDRR